MKPINKGFNELKDQKGNRLITNLPNRFSPEHTVLTYNPLWFGEDEQDSVVFSVNGLPTQLVRLNVLVYISGRDMI